MILPVEGLFTSAISTYRDKVVSIIKQSNLKKTRQLERSQSNLSLTDKLIIQWKNKRPIAIAILIVLVVIGLSSFTNALRDIKSFIIDVFGAPTQHQTVAIQELDTEVNSRFGFSFSYPHTWDRSDPANADGNSYTDPKDQRVSFSAWGGFAVVTQNLDDFASFTLRSAETQPGFRLILNQESGRHLIGWDTVGTTFIETRQPIEGRRIVYEIRESAERYTVMQVFTQVDDIQFSLQCRAPSSLFSAYEDLFLTLSSSLRVLSKKHEIFNSR
jgi:hypothetical protein